MISFSIPVIIYCAWCAVRRDLLNFLRPWLPFEENNRSNSWVATRDVRDLLWVPDTWYDGLVTESFEAPVHPLDLVSDVNKPRCRSLCSHLYQIQWVHRCFKWFCHQYVISRIWHSKGQPDHTGIHRVNMFLMFKLQSGTRHSFCLYLYQVLLVLQMMLTHFACPRGFPIEGTAPERWHCYGW